MDWLYVGIVVFVIFLIYKERQALGCPTIPDGTDCDNINGKAVKGTQPHEDDDKLKLIEKIEHAAAYGDRDVIWRRCILFSMISIIVYNYLINKTFPKAYDLLCGAVVGAAISYFATSFYKFHLTDHIKNNIMKSLKMLREKI